MAFHDSVLLPPHPGGESGSADTVRDPRGFAVKFYTNDGLWDLTGNNTPIFFIRDPMFVSSRNRSNILHTYCNTSIPQFPSFIHTQKRNPKTHLKVESAHVLTYSVHPSFVILSPPYLPFLLLPLPCLYYLLSLYFTTGS